jgi:hypothetical protein
VTTCALCTEEVVLLRDLGVALAPAVAVNVAAIVAALPAPPARGPQLVRSGSDRRTARRPLYAQRWLQYAAALVLVAGAGSVLVSRTGLVRVTPSEMRAAVATQAPDLAAVAGASDLSEAELRGLLNEIDNLQSVPAEESEDVVRGVSGTSSTETDL